MKALLIINLLLMFILSCTNKNSSVDPTAMLFRLGLKSTKLSFTNVPGRMTVNLPRSMRSNTISTKSVFLKGFQKADGVTEISEGHEMLTNVTEKIALVLDEAKYELILIHDLVAEAKKQPGVCIPGGTRQIEITNQIMDEIKSTYTEYGYTEADASAAIEEFQKAGDLPRVGEKISSPAILYNKNKGGYDHEVLFASANKSKYTAACPADEKSYKSIIRYDSDFSRLLYGITDKIKVFGMELEIEGAVTYSSGSGKHDAMSFHLEQRQTGVGSPIRITENATMEECAADNNKDECLMVKIISDISYPGISTDPNAHKPDHRIEVTGKSDANGGLVKVTADESGEISYYKESFDGMGKILGVLKSTNGTTYSTIYGSLNEATNPYSVTFSFNHDTEVTLKLPASQVGTVMDGENFTAYDKFVLVTGGHNHDPNNDHYSIIGLGTYEKKDADTIVDLDEIDILYWGESGEISTAEVWRKEVDSNHNVKYVKLTDKIVLK